jgi:hypothetical protein
MNTPIRENYYPIHDAVTNNNITAVKYLLPNVDCTILSPIGTPLMIAAKKCNIKIIQLLLQVLKIEAIMMKDDTGKNWLHYLAMNSKIPITHFLLKTWTIKLTTKDFENTSALDIIKLNYVNTPEYNLFIRDIIFKLPPLFTFCGHGCDTGIEKTVPPQCMYVTLSVCGNNIQYHNMKNFYSIDPELLKDPIKNKQAIETIIGIPIQIYKAGDIYSDVFYETPREYCLKKDVFNGVEKIRNTAYQSGLHNVYFMNTDKFDCDSNLKENMFKFSILPTLDSLKDTTKENINILWKKQILQSYLFETLKIKGIFYNIVCRGACSGSEEHVQLRRSKSVKMREDQKMVITLEQLRELYPIVEESKEETLQESKEDVVDNRKRLLEYIDNPHLYLKGPKETILSELSSIFPEKELKMLLYSRIIGGKKSKIKKTKTRRHKL